MTKSVDCILNNDKEVVIYRFSRFVALEQKQTYSNEMKLKKINDRRKTLYYKGFDEDLGTIVQEFKDAICNI